VLAIANPRARRAVVRGRELASNHGASVGGPVVDENQFPVRQLLITNAAHGVLQKALLVKENQHDGDEWHGVSVGMRRAGNKHFASAHQHSAVSIGKLLNSLGAKLRRWYYPIGPFGSLEVGTR
jgi:hypothetical protein